MKFLFRFREESPDDWHYDDVIEDPDPHHHNSQSNWLELRNTGDVKF